MNNSVSSCAKNWVNTLQLSRVFGVLGLSLIALVALTSCGFIMPSNTAAPVSGIDQLHPSVYVVKYGDTVSRIANAFGISEGNIIIWNNLRAPYRLYVGQQLHLSAPGKKAQHVAPIRTVSTVSQSSQSQNVSVKNTSAPPPPPKVTFEQTKPKSAYQSQTRTEKKSNEHVHRHSNQTTRRATDERQKKVQLVTTGSKKTAQPQAKQVKSAAPVKPKNWVQAKSPVSYQGCSWPVSGLYEPMDLSKPTTVTLQAKSASVYASCSGKVIYVGPDVNGQDHLVITKVKGVLFAYGHLVGADVKEGQSIHRGTHIADAAREHGQYKLTLQLRKAGKLVAPADYLPS